MTEFHVSDLQVSLYQYIWTNNILQIRVLSDNIN